MCFDFYTLNSLINVSSSSVISWSVSADDEISSTVAVCSSVDAETSFAIAEVSPIIDFKKEKINKLVD